MVEKERKRALIYRDEKGLSTTTNTERPAKNTDNGQRMDNGLCINSSAYYREPYCREAPMIGTLREMVNFWLII